MESVARLLGGRRWDARNGGNSRLAHDFSAEIGKTEIGGLCRQGVK